MGLIKHSIRGTHVSISQQLMRKYLDEFTFHANHREESKLIFDRLVAAFFFHGRGGFNEFRRTD